MDLMTGSTSISVLEKKYNNFKAASCEIKVGSSKLVSGKQLLITELTVELTCGYEASGCSFTIADAYNFDKSDFISAVSCLSVGEKLEIEVGYVRRETVFNGYISDISYSFTHGDVYINVQGMDIKGLLMKSRRLEFFTEKSADAVVSKILSAGPVSSYLSGKTIDKCPEDEVPLRSHQMTDYELIVEQAQKNGYEFFVLCGKAYFRKKKKVTSSLLTLEPMGIMLDANITFSAQPLVKEFEIRSIDQEKGELVTGSATISGSFGKGSSKMISSTKQVFYEAGVKDANEAKDRAKARSEEAADGFGTLECTCVGIPELVPGRFISLKKMGSDINGKYYINYVRHTMNAQEFKTDIRASRSSL